jgi:iron(II)-dependent oxidoreductase
MTTIAPSPRTRRRTASTTVLAALDRARRRTDELLAPLSDEELAQQVSSLQSPLIWDYAHIAYFEELWLLRRVGGEEPSDDRFDDLYDAFLHERGERGALPILRPERARAYAADVRARTAGLLRRIHLDPADRLLSDGFVFGLVVQHELQHGETMLQTLALRDRPYRPFRDARLERPLPRAGTGRVDVAAGPFLLGAEDEPWAYDNERDAHTVELPAFAIDALPVSNRSYLSFVDAGGYYDRSHWSDAGWRWRLHEEADAPLGWERHGARWLRHRFGLCAPLELDAPVQNVSFWEAEAYARWAGGRLPTEAEWEKAAPQLQGRGNVWEWTASPFTGYPGFEAFPYAEYSEVFFGDEYRVLRGGSWATDPLVARITFRNWDYPQRRQIFSGIRVAYDV